MPRVPVQARETASAEGVGSPSGGRPSRAGGARSCGETRPAVVAARHRNPLPATPRPQRPTNSSHSRSDFAGSGARAEARQIRATRRVTGPVSTASTHSAGYLGYSGYDPAVASLFVVTLRCGAGLPGYLLARAVTVVAVCSGGRVTPIAAGNARKCWSLGAGNQVTSVTRFFAGPREIRRRTSNCRAAFNFPGRSLTASGRSDEGNLTA